VFEYQPSFSADGRKILYTTWSDAAQGSIRELDLSTGAARTLSTEPGFYYQPRFSPNGQHIVYIKSGGSALTGSLNSSERGIYLTPAGAWAPNKIADGGEPQFTPDSKRVLYMSGGDLSKVMSIGINGDKPRELRASNTRDSAAQPDGKRVAFTELYIAYAAPLPARRQHRVSKDTTAATVLRPAPPAYLHWSDANTAH
jgi:Tol biopolymer transport system component